MRNLPPRILLALGWYDHRLHRGIEKYAREMGWYVRMDYVRDRIIPWGWEGDGVLTWLGANDELAEFVSSLGVPTVDFSFRRPHLNFVRVLEDTQAASQLVAEHLIARGVRSFIYYSDADNWVYDERGRFFQQEITRNGFPCHWVRWQSSSLEFSPKTEWNARRQWLVKHLELAEKPVGIFAACDGLALDVLEACDHAGITVPDEVAVVGAGDSLLAVNSMKTPISSVDTDLELLGYRGALELDKLLKRRSPPSSPLRIPPACLVVRKSSDLLAVNHEGIARSLRYIWENYHSPLRVEQLARIAAMSTRNFHKLFVRHLGRGPGAEIQRARVEQAKRLLKESEDKLAAIAYRCGYPGGSNSLSVAIKKATGLSPSAYRAQWAVAKSTNGDGRSCRSNGTILKREAGDLSRSLAHRPVGNGAGARAQSLPINRRSLS